MSSALAQPPAISFPGSSRSGLTSFRQGPQRYTGYIKSWQSLLKEGRSGIYFSSGLLTPPESRAMTGISLNQHKSNAVSSHNYYPSKFSYSSYPSGRAAEVRYHQNVDSHDDLSRPTENQQQHWSTTRGREDQHVSKDTSISDSTIASYLQIPSSINNSRGSLAEFAAEVGEVMLTRLRLF